MCHCRLHSKYLQRHEAHVKYAKIDPAPKPAFFGERDDLKLWFGVDYWVSANVLKERYLLTTVCLLVDSLLNH